MPHTISADGDNSRTILEWHLQVLQDCRHHAHGVGKMESGKWSGHGSAGKYHVQAIYACRLRRSCSVEATGIHQTWTHDSTARRVCLDFELRMAVLAATLYFSTTCSDFSADSANDRCATPTLGQGMHALKSPGRQNGESVDILARRIFIT